MTIEETIAQMAERLGIRLPGQESKPRKRRVTPRVTRTAPLTGRVGRPCGTTKCDHDNRRMKTFVKNGKTYVSSECRTCAAARMRERRQ